MCPVVVPVSAELEPLRSAILHSVDGRAAVQLSALRERYAEVEVILRSGQSLGAQSLLAKLLWLRQEEPEVWARTRYVLGSTGYIVARLTESVTADHFSAADGGLGYDLGRRSWDFEVLESEEIPFGLLPPLSWPAEIVGGVTRNAAAGSGLPEGLPVVVGTGDALAELIATGATEPGEGALLYGTTLSTMIHAAERSAVRSIVTVPGWRPEQLVHSATLSAGSGLLEWWGRLTGQQWDGGSFARLDEQLKESPPGARGLVSLPYISGMRSAPHVRGALLGISAEHVASDVARSQAEGLAHALRRELAGSSPPGRLVAIGGGAQSRGLLQVMSDVCGFEQVRMERNPGAPLGAAWLAGYGVGACVEGSQCAWANSDGITAPNLSLRGLYEAAHREYLRALRMVSSYSARLAATSSP